MSKKRLSIIAEELSIPLDELKKLAKEKLANDMINGPGLWVTEEGQNLLRAAAFIPELVPKHHSGTYLMDAKNSKFIFVKLNSSGIKVPVLIPRKMIGKFSKGKKIYLEEIKDQTGSSYRYASGR